MRAAGGLLIVDEVQTGFARTGAHFWGFEAHGVVPDVIVMSKGIGNGFPIAAVVTRREVAEAMAQRMFFNTYGSNPTCCAAGRAVLRAIDDEGLQANARRVGGHILDGLRELQTRHERDRRRARPRPADRRRGRARRASPARPMPRPPKPCSSRLLGRGFVVGMCGREHNVLKINPPLVRDRGRRRPAPAGDRGITRGGARVRLSAPVAPACPETTRA